MINHKTPNTWRTIVSDPEGFDHFLKVPGPLPGMMLNSISLLVLGFANAILVKDVQQAPTIIQTSKTS
jgi:hypothetical protein